LPALTRLASIMIGGVLVLMMFVIVGGVVAVMKTPLDALPDLSDVQVIVYTEYPGQAPQVVEDQVTYPLTTAMLAVPKSKVVRGFSFFGASFVYVIFEDGTDIYWARSRVLEYLSTAAGRLPQGVAPQIGPDATGVGWVYQYALLAKDKTLAELEEERAGVAHLLVVHDVGGARDHAHRLAGGLEQRLPVGAVAGGEGGVELARQFGGVGAARGLGLAALQALGPVKSALARQMMFGRR